MRSELMERYFAAISFIDKQLGRVLDALDAENLLHNTTIVLTSSTGVHQGEKGIW